VTRADAQKWRDIGNGEGRDCDGRNMGRDWTKREHKEQNTGGIGEIENVVRER